VVPDPEGDPMVQVEEPVPDKEKSPTASPVTASLNTTSYTIVVLFVIVVRGAKVVSDGPRDSIVSEPAPNEVSKAAEVEVPLFIEPPPPPPG
jgi:hypothetical protein